MIKEYWERTTVVARAGSYYGKGFKGGRGVTQGDPLSPTILNVVVDAVVRHWLTIAVKEAEKRGERGREGRHQAALFYADDGMLASFDPQWLPRHMMPWTGQGVWRSSKDMGWETEFGKC